LIKHSKNNKYDNSTREYLRLSNREVDYRLVSVVKVTIKGVPIEIVTAVINGKTKVSRAKTSPFNHISHILGDRKLKETNNTCSKCGNYANVVHHKDGKRYDHSLDNLVPLCVSCHTKLHKNGLDR
jgi:hypothetical protein